MHGFTLRDIPCHPGRLFCHVGIRCCGQRQGRRRDTGGEQRERERRHGTGAGSACLWMGNGSPGRHAAWQKKRHSPSTVTRTPPAERKTASPLSASDARQNGFLRHSGLRSSRRIPEIGRCGPAARIRGEHLPLRQKARKIVA